MFTLAQSETFKAKVKVNVAMENGGWKEESFMGIFKRMPESERDRLQNLKNTDLVREVMTGWEMEDQARRPVEFSEQNFEAFLQMTGAVREATLTFWAHNVGAKEKN
ncbi:MAG: hypothetical protein ACO1PM_08090 [Acidovorax sp.]